jgi:hypothetical protein
VLTVTLASSVVGGIAYALAGGEVRDRSRAGEAPTEDSRGRRAPRPRSAG